MAPYVFISHRSLDKAFAFAVAEVLHLAGVPYYLDAEDPELAAASRHATTTSVEKALRRSSHIIGIISPFSRNSWWVSYEIGIARECGAKIAAVIQSDVRIPEYLDSVTILDSRVKFIEWVSLLGSPLAIDTELTRRLDGWLARNSAKRVSLYRNAIDHMESLWYPETWTALRLEDPEYAFRGRWMGCASDELIHILYSTFAPVVTLKSRTAGLSEADALLIDEMYKAFANDELLARITPVRRYAARKCTNWREQRRDDPATYWLQGLLPRDLDAAIRCMLNSMGGLLPREAVAAQYVDLYKNSVGASQKPLGLAANALQGFELITRPIYARMMAVQVRLCNALLQIEQNGEASVRQASLFELEPRSPIRGTEEESVSQQYIQDHVLPSLTRAIG